MSWEWLTLKNWKYFPNDIQQRCDSIADRTARQISGFGTVEKYNGSHSFKFVIKEGSSKTMAKLIPHHLYSSPVILSAFSAAEPEARNYAARFDMRVDEFVVMHEPFFVSRVPADWHADKVAEVISQFMRGGQSRKRLAL